MKLLIFFGIICTAVAVHQKQQCIDFMDVNVKDASKDILSMSIAMVDFRIYSDITLGPKPSKLQQEDALKSLTVPERQKTGKYSLYMLIAICKDASFDCRLCDIFFIATELAKGDPDCFLSCTAQEVGGSLPQLPTENTLETYMKVGVELKKKANTKSEKEALTRKGAELTGDDKKHKKRAIFLFPVIVGALMAIINVCSAAAIGWASANAQESGSSLGTAVDVVGPVIDVAKAGGGCFMASSRVNVQLKNMKTVAKPLSDVHVGDLVESFDEITGKVMFTPVYYMAHSIKKRSSPLLSVNYRNENHGISKLGLSGRHLVYATKANKSISEPPFNHPIQTKDLKIGDHLWVMSKNKKLKPQPIIDIIPFDSEVRHPLTENHHIIVDGVHASVHVLNEPLYRMMTSPLRFLFYINPNWNNSGFVETMVNFVESVKEPMFNYGLISSISGFSMANTISM